MNCNSSDVNTIYAFINPKHRFNEVVNCHLQSIKDQKYILLRHVKSVFIFSYGDNLNKIGEIIISSVNKVRKILDKRIIKRKPSDNIKNAYLKSEMDKLIGDWGKLDNADYEYYKNMLLNDFPLIELLNDKEKLVKFDSTYIKKAKEIVDTKIGEFIGFFDNLEDSPKLNPTKIKEWYEKIRQMKLKNLSIYTDHKDEDIRLSSEFFTYCQDRNIPLNFASADKNIVHSMKVVIEGSDDLKCGKIMFLLDE